MWTMPHPGRRWSDRRIGSRPPATFTLSVEAPTRRDIEHEYEREPFGRRGRRRLRRRRLRQGARQARRDGDRSSIGATTTSSSRCSTRWPLPSWRPRHRPPAAGHLPQGQDRRRQDRRGHRPRPGDAHRHHGRRPDVQRRLPRDRCRIAAELLQHAGRRGALVPAVHRGERQERLRAADRRVPGGRRGPAAHRPGCAEHRHRRRRPDRCGDRRGDGRLRQRGCPAVVPPPRRQAHAHLPRRSRLGRAGRLLRQGP